MSKNMNLEGMGFTDSEKLIANRQRTVVLTQGELLFIRTILKDVVEHPFNLNLVGIMLCKDLLHKITGYINE